MAENESTDNWLEYFEKTKGRNPRPLLTEALQFVKDRDEALDLGASALNETKYLLKEGFKHVTAIDIQPVARKLAETIPREKLSYIISSFDTFDFPLSFYDLVNAGYSLPFSSPRTFDAMFDRLQKSLKVGGVFTGQLFGERDEWNVSSRNMTFHTKEEAAKLFSKMDILKFIEEEKDQPTVITSGIPKHWHIFHVIAKAK
ncbi:MAG: class I SAM-dependent methyltransferase [Minisyncoccia bacterium]|jgi:hypothetical protein